MPSSGPDVTAIMADNRAQAIYRCLFGYLCITGREIVLGQDAVRRCVHPCAAQCSCAEVLMYSQCLRRLQEHL